MLSYRNGGTIFPCFLSHARWFSLLLPHLLLMSTGAIVSQSRGFVQRQDRTARQS